MNVLHIVHNHPRFHPGGTEIFAHDLFRALKRLGIGGLFAACTGPHQRAQHPGTLLQAAGDAPDEVLLWAGHFDRFNLAQVDLYGVVPALRDLIGAARPDVIHFHHLMFVGAEALFAARRFAPDARIVVSLHDFYPICALDGLMLAADGRLCARAAPEACMRCLPDRTADQLVLREGHIKGLLGLADLLVAPSAFLRERFAGWGIARERIEVIANGRPAARPAPARTAARRDAFGFVGNLMPAKGVEVLLEAAQILAREGTAFTLALHGGIHHQPDAFRARLEAAIAAAPHTTAHGTYDAAGLRARMADVDWVVMPSLWWENAPLVIAEARQHRRPVICSGIGGMAEAVRDGIDGLWAPPGDAAALAAVLRRAAGEPGLWARLRRAAPPARGIDAAARDHAGLYRRLRGGAGMRLPAAPSAAILPRAASRRRA